MQYNITQVEYNQQIKKKIMLGMNAFAKSATGIDGWYGETFCFVATDADIFVGGVVIDIIYGQLRVEYLFVAEEYRKQHIGSALLTQALEFGKNNGCSFAFLETLNFQAPEFYEQHGFKLQFSLPGFQNGIVFHYYKKDL